jgi:hypothetical protein
MKSKKEVMDEDIIVDTPTVEDEWDDNKQHTEQMF